MDTQLQHLHAPSHACAEPSHTCHLSVEMKPLWLSNIVLCTLLYTFVRLATVCLVLTNLTDLRTLDARGRVLLLGAGPGDGRRALGRALWRPVAVVVAGQRPESRAHGSGRGSREAEPDARSRVQAVWKRLLKRADRRCCRRRLSVVEVRCAGCHRHRPRCCPRVRPAAVGRTAVQALESGVVAGFGQQLETHGRLPLPLGPERRSEL